MSAHLIIVSPPTLAFSDRIVKAHEPVLVQTLRPELAVEAIDERVIGRRTKPRAVQRDALHVCPQIEVSGDELAAVINPDRGRISNSPQTRASTSMTSGARKLNGGTTARENRLNVSITVRIRSLDPVASWSWTKPMADTSFEHNAAQRPSLTLGFFQHERDLRLAELRSLHRSLRHLTLNPKLEFSSSKRPRKRAAGRHAGVGMGRRSCITNRNSAATSACDEHDF